MPGIADQVHWSSVAIGYEPPALISPSADSGLLKVRGAGNDIWAERDEFYYVFTPLPDDGALTVRLWEFEHVHEWSKAGIMLRESLDPAAANVLLYVSGENGALMQARLENGAATGSAGQVEGLGAGTWLKLGRWGDEVVGQYSTDGFDWHQLGRYTLNLGSDPYIGLAVTSHDPTQLASAGFSDLDLLQGDMGDPPAPADVQPPADEPPAEDPPSDDPPGGSEPDDPAPTDPAPNPTPPAAGAWVCGSQPLSPRYEPTLYVATNGNDSNDGRSESRAFRTLQRAANVAQAGDVVWVRGGTYSSDVSFQGAGSASSPIVFESYPGECAVLDGSGQERHQTVRFEGARHYVFRNFEVRNSPAQGIHVVDSRNVLVSNVRSHHNGLSGIQNVGGADNHYTYFIVHDNSDGREGNADGIGISSGQNIRIDRCAAFRNSDDGIDAWKSQDTVIEYCVSFENGFQGGDGNGFKAGGHTNGNAVLRHNLAWGNKTQGFNYNSGAGITFENNTSYDNDYYGFIAADATLRNNLSYGNARREWQDDGGNDQSANSWNLGMDDPRFASTDPRSPEFLALASSSGAIGRASAAAGTDSDDLGALPYGETIGSFLGIDVAALLSY